MNEAKLHKKPTVSVVCATYNRSKMVRETVLAAWNQTLRPDEIVVSDDCSPDDTLEVLRELQKEVPILKIVESLKNSGGVPNWNQVIEASSGDIIAWCSDDDRWTSHHLENAVRYLIQNNDVDLVHAGFDEVRENEDGTEKKIETTLKSSQPIIVTRKNIVEYMGNHFSWYFHPSTLVFRRQAWLKIGKFNQKYALADTDWFIRAALHHKLVYLPYKGVINRRHYSKEGNWSIRVGSINMQKEFYDSILNFVDTAKHFSDVVDLDLQLRRWENKYRFLIFRIYISRSRAGIKTVPKDCVCELIRVTPILMKVQKSFIFFLAELLSNFLSLLQYALPGGKAKYSALGKHSAM